MPSGSSVARRFEVMLRWKLATKLMGRNFEKIAVSDFFMRLDLKSVVDPESSRLVAGQGGFD
jgi:hypothetical protein